MPPRVDIVVLGATGFTGKLITRYLEAHPERSEFTFAIAGRSAQKLAELARDLSLNEAGTPERSFVHTFVVDTLDYPQVEEVVKSCKVVINTVGPYWKYSTNVVKACARQGTHYVDITGEVPWVKDLIDDYDFMACKTKAIIVPSCGFDSLPSDMSVHLSTRALHSRVSPDISAAQSLTAHKMKGGFSGGTVATALSLFEEYPRDKLQAATEDFILSPIKGTPSRAPRLVYSLPQVIPKIYGSFFPMSSVNEAVVRRTWGIRQALSQTQSAPHSPELHPYGMEFTYEEFQYARGPISAGLLSLGVAFGVVAIMFPPVRWVLRYFLPSPGQGPSEKTMQEGSLVTTNVTSSAITTQFPEATYAETVIKGKGDPGYLLTALMVSESALTILRDYSKLSEFARRGGILTPMIALGDVLIGRLERSGRFEFSTGILGDGHKRT